MVTKNFPLFDGSGFGKNVILFCVNMSSSGHDDNRKKDTVDSLYSNCKGPTNLFEVEKVQDRENYRKNQNFY